MELINRFARYPIQFEPKPTASDVEVIENGIMHQAYEKKGLPPLDFFAFFIRNENGEILGGCTGNTLYGSLYIDSLWVTESIRQKGYGSDLIKAAEQFGMDNGCAFSTVNTMDWEALGFYQKLGYFVEFERHGFSGNSVFYFLRKSLSSDHGGPFGL